MLCAPALHYEDVQTALWRMELASCGGTGACRRTLSQLLQPQVSPNCVFVVLLRWLFLNSGSKDITGYVALGGAEWSWQLSMTKAQAEGEGEGSSLGHIRYRPTVRICISCITASKSENLRQ